MVKDKNCDDSATILEDAEVMQIPRDEFLGMIYSDISIATKFIRIVAQNVKEKEERLFNLAYGSLRKRVANALLDIHEKFNKDGQKNLIEFLWEDIAQYVGTATECLRRTLSDFKSEGLIEIKERKDFDCGVTQVEDSVVLNGCCWFCEKQEEQQAKN